MKVSILDDWLDTLRHLPCFSRLAGHDVQVWNDHVDDEQVLAERLQHTQALVLFRERTRITRALLERLPRLRLISLRSAYPHIDVDACTERGVVVSSNLHADSPSYAAAELTWGLVLAAARQIPQQAAALRAGRWQASIGTTLRGQTLGILGYGRIGRAVAGYGRAFGMRVCVLARPESLRAAQADGYETASGRGIFFEQCDVLSVHLRLVAATRASVTAADFARMKPSALFVNTSRAGLVEPGALVAALQAGRPGRAAVDVFEEEPLTDVTHPLLNLPQALCTPHIGYVTHEELELQFADVFEQVNAFAVGAPTHVVNPGALAPARTSSRS